MNLRFLFFLLLLPTFLLAQKNINRFKHQERHGKWIIHTDSTLKYIDNTGRYRKGIQKGTWKYYDFQGHLIKKEKHVFRTIKTTQYHPNGKIYKQGKAKMLYTKEFLHFYYFGDWELYDSLGEHTATWTYKEGIRIAERNYKTGAQKHINDSLVKIVQALNTRFFLYTDSISEAKYGKRSMEYNRLVSLSNLNALKVMEDVDKLILKYGYPGKTLVGNEYAIIFSIISSAPLSYKEKHYNTIIAAADKGELNWEDVAYFVDKIKVAKKEKQVYGTQFTLGETDVLYFPIENIEKLNERRTKVGLEKLNTKEMKFSTY